MARIDIRSYVAQVEESSLARWSGLEPWDMTTRAEQIVRELFSALDPDLAVSDEICIHPSSRIEKGAIVKAPAIIGPNCFVAAGAYLRGGVWLESDCIVGPGSELKSSFVFRGAKLAHLNFVGDSVLGKRVNLEAGAVVANYRNEQDSKTITIKSGNDAIDTQVEKFGALIGDDVRVGANAVIAPGALIPPGTVVPRLGLIDQSGR